MSREVETDEIFVEYTVTSDPVGYDIETIEVYVPALHTWLDVTHVSAFMPAAIKTVEKDLVGNY